MPESIFLVPVSIWDYATIIFLLMRIPRNLAVENSLTAILSIESSTDSVARLAFILNQLQSNLYYPDLDYPELFSGPNLVMNIYKSQSIIIY